MLLPIPVLTENLFRVVHYIVLWWSEGFQGPSIGPPWFRDAGLSDICSLVGDVSCLNCTLINLSEKTNHNPNLVWFTCFEIELSVNDDMTLNHLRDFRLSVLGAPNKTPLKPTVHCGYMWTEKFKGGYEWCPLYGMGRDFRLQNPVSLQINKLFFWYKIKVFFFYSKKIIDLYLFKFKYDYVTSN